MRKRVPDRRRRRHEALTIGRLRTLQIARLLGLFCVLAWVLLMELGLRAAAIPPGTAGALLLAWSRRP
jgi:hypothetical protein